MRYCSKCGNKLSDDQLYCPKCGNKEPFVKNEQQSSWKDFDVNDKKATNVNYDFQTIAPAVAPVANIAFVKNKGLRALGITIRIFTLVVGIFLLVTSPILTFTNLLNKNGRDIIGIVGIALTGTQLILLTILIIVSVSTKNWNPVLKGLAPAWVTLSIMAVGFTIGQFFMSRSTGMAPFGIFTGAMSFMLCGMLAKPYSFKKAAK